MQLRTAAACAMSLVCSSAANSYWSADKASGAGQATVRASAGLPYFACTAGKLVLGAGVEVIAAPPAGTPARFEIVFDDRLPVAFDVVSTKTEAGRFEVVVSESEAVLRLARDALSSVRAFRATVTVANDRLKAESSGTMTGARDAITAVLKACNMASG